ncbi:MAG: hypothetical protein ABGX83_05545 [Nitrospira sp.]
MAYVGFTSNQEIKQKEKAAELLDITPERPIIGLAAHLARCWEEAKRGKLRIEQQMLKNLRQRNGQYEPEKLNAIKQMEGSEVFVMATETKCQAAHNWVMDIMKPAGDKPWEIKPTPEPDLPPGVEEEVRENVKMQVLQEIFATQMASGELPDPAEVADEIHARSNQIQEAIEDGLMDRAKDAAEKMSTRISDILVEGGWEEAFMQVVDDIITFPAGIIKSPVFMRRNVRKWVRDNTGQYSPKEEKKIVMDFQRVSPFDGYPEPDTSTINEGYFIERHRLTRKQLNELIGVPGYNDAAIYAVLEEYGQGGIKEWLIPDQERLEEEAKESTALYQSSRIQALEYWGPVQGKDLLEWGMPSERIENPLLDYEVNAWWVGRHVIKAVINPDQTGEKPYGMGVFRKIPGALWGKGLPQVIADSQDIINATARALINNVGISSGPQVEIDHSRMLPGEDTANIWPWRIWRTTNVAMSTSPAIRFYQPQINAGPLLEIFEKFDAQIDEQSGVPKFSHGDPNIQGAGKTASGLSMLMTAAARGIKALVAEIDSKIVAPSITRIFDYLMRFDPDMSIKGDLKVVTRGVASLMAREQRSMRINEALANTNNPADLAIMTLPGRRELMKEGFKSLDVDVEKIVPEADVDALEGALQEEEGGPPGKGNDPSQKPKAKKTDAAGGKAQGEDTKLQQRKAAGNP